MIIPAFQHRPDESLVVANLKENKVEQYKILGAIALENTKLICQLAAKGGGGGERVLVGGYKNITKSYGEIR